MKKLSIFLSLLALMLCLASTALAADPSYSTTIDFLSAMDANEYSYTFVGTNENKREIVTSVFVSDVDVDVKFTLFFDQNEDSVSIYVWNVIEFDPANRAQVLDACNAANANYRFSNYYVDDSDNTVTQQLDIMLPVRYSGDVCVDTLSTMLGLFEKVYPMLAPFDK